MADDDGWKRHDAEQRRAWRELSFAQRLEWLWQAKLFARRALGRARLESPVFLGEAKASPPIALGAAGQREFAKRVVAHRRLVVGVHVVGRVQTTCPRGSKAARRE